MVSVKKFPPADPTGCPNGPNILRWASLFGLVNARLVHDSPFGWHLVVDQGQAGNAAADLLILSGGGSTHWHQISPQRFGDPSLRADEMLNACVAALDAKLDLPANTWRIYVNEDGTVRTEHGFEICQADQRSMQLAKFIHR